MVEFKPLRKPKFNATLQLEHMLKGNKVNAKLVKEFDGIYLKFEDFVNRNGIMQAVSKDILITVEDKFDVYDLRAVNDILNSKKLSFVKFK